MARQLDGLALGAIAAGGLFTYAGVKGYSVPHALQALVQGKKPGTGGQANPITGSSAGSSSGTGGTINATAPGSGSARANQALGRLMAGGYGWAAGQNWQALNYGWGTLESGWNARARNPSSGAFGIAQALGHGIPATAAADGTNEYGPMNLNISIATCKAANEGSAEAQIAWGLAYIKATDGSPAQVPGWLGQGGYSGY